ncbi:hypothetical protein [Streptomyces platensis]|uniref:hypothetical protein n=1 Tax=Streptomyces platensis TaxID=58346 RepID=UPI0036C28E62
MSNQRRLEGRSELLVAVQVLSGVHDRNDASMSDPPPDATGDTQPDGDGLNHTPPVNRPAAGRSATAARPVARDPAQIEERCGAPAYP